RIGFNGSITFYDALLPHVAREEDQDRVSALGYAIGYLGGGLLLAINVAMIQVWGFEIGARMSFVSVAVWWLVFSIPLFLRVPEPPAATAHTTGRAVFAETTARLSHTFREIRHYRELLRFLIAFLIYNDGIGTIIGVAAIYATELGFGALETILVLLLVQFVGIPFSLVFGRLPNPEAKHRPAFLGFILFLIVALPSVAIAGRFLLPLDVSGAAPLPYETTETALGQGTYIVAAQDRIGREGNWADEVVAGELLKPTGLLSFLNDPFGGPAQDATYVSGSSVGDALEVPFNGQKLEVVYAAGPNSGTWSVEVDGTPLLDDEGQPVLIDAYSPAPRYGVRETIEVEDAGEHALRLVNNGEQNAASGGTALSLYSVEVLPPARAGGFGLIGQIVGLLVVLNLVGLAFGFGLGPLLFRRLAATLDTRRAIILALVTYSIIAVWGFFLDSTIEFWFLAWMVAIVQGGSQALSRSLYAAMSPSSKSGEFFGLFAIMEKFASLFGPLVFAFAGLALGNSRWGVLSLIAFFLVGIAVLLTVNVEEGKRVARADDEALLKAGAVEG
ncbi:MAG: MFS transporter, partial [Anaerolineae bacterium]|nr:MFS transporter [Anaerolineae bacterium]